MLRFIALRLQVVKALLSEDRWFETVKYTSALTKLLSYFFEVNCAKKVKADKEVTRRNTRTLSLSKYQIQGTCTEKEKVQTVARKLKTRFDEADRVKQCLSQ